MLMGRVRFGTKRFRFRFQLDWSVPVTIPTRNLMHGSDSGFETCYMVPEPESEPSLRRKGRGRGVYLLLAKNVHRCCQDPRHIAREEAPLMDRRHRGVGSNLDLRKG